MAINSEFFNRNVDEVGKDLVGRTLSRKVNGVLVECAITKARVYNRPNTKAVSQEWKDGFEGGAVWINNRGGYLITNVILFGGDSCLSLAEITTIVSGQPVSLIESAWIAPYFGLSKDANGKQITDLFEIGEKLPGTVLVKAELNQSDNYARTFCLESDKYKIQRSQR